MLLWQSCTRHCLIITWRLPTSGDQPCCQMLAGPGQRHPARNSWSGAIEVPVQTQRCMQGESIPQIDSIVNFLLSKATPTAQSSQFESHQYTAESEQQKLSQTVKVLAVKAIWYKFCND